MITSLVQYFAAECTRSFFGFPAWYKYLKPTEANHCQILDLKIPGDLILIALAVVEILLRVAALVAVFYVIYGGIQYVTSEGKPDRVGHAQQTIINALIGLAIALLATPFVAFIANRIS